MKRLFVIAVAILAPAGAATGQVDVPRTYGDAMRWYDKAAAAGSPQAQFLLGVMLDTGTNRPRDPAKAVRWFTRAANQGHALAQYKLGVAFQTGRGVAADPAQAALWYAKAAGLGLTQAEYNLALLYENGIGVTRDRKEAGRLYRRAAEKGLALAQQNLGVLYASGNNGVPLKLIEAWTWLSLAAAQGRADAATARDAVAGRMSEAERQRALQTLDRLKQRLP